MKDLKKYTSELIKIVGRPEEMARVYAKCSDREDLGYYILTKYNYMTNLIRKFVRENSIVSFGIEKEFLTYKTCIVSTIEHSSMELCDKYGLNWVCYDNKCIYVDGKQIFIVDGFATICDAIVTSINKEKALVRKESL